ncbi:MAG TPA: HDOD domain-containing protein [Planctomycetaceae bacterium]|nr:HDOD domain-containing protein [Planctomycetaceae bacterium]HQZ63720.1 HDOD domain-containing protein [Planctomycetaceae bacterium]
MSATLTQKPAARSETMDDALQALQDGANCELPVLPEVAAQLLKLTGDVNCEVSDIVPLIKRDQSLTSHLLRISNTVRYNTGVAVSSVQQAVARLGLLAVREIVVLISCKCRVFDVPEFESQVRASFRHSLATAAFAQEIARVRRMNVEEAFLCGLLHDVGRPILFQMLSDRRKSHGLVVSQQEILTAADTHRIPFAAMLIGQWQLSDRVAEAVRFQLAPRDAPACSVQAAALNLAMDLANSILDPDAIPSPNNEQHPMLEVLSLYPEQFAAILTKREHVLEWVDSTT